MVFEVAWALNARKRLERGLVASACVVVALACGKTSDSDEPSGSGGSGATNGGAGRGASGEEVPAACASSVTSGSDHSCALYDDGSVWCWGDNTLGQLGNGANESSATPVQADVSGAVAVVAGARHTCAIVGARELWCWGDNRDGQLGPGVGAASNHPQRVQVGLVTGPIQEVALGETQTCVIDSLLHAVCWGTDASGVRSEGTLAAVSEMGPVTRLFGGYARMYAELPDSNLFDISSGAASERFAPSGVSRVIEAAIGANHACAVHRSGMVWCWHHATPEQSPYQGMMVALGAEVVDVGVGERTACALHENGTVSCLDEAGARRDERFTDAVDLAMGQRHLCAVLRDGSVSCLDGLELDPAASPYSVTNPAPSQNCRQIRPLSERTPLDRYVDAWRAWAETLCRCAFTEPEALRRCAEEESMFNTRCLAALPQDPIDLSCKTEHFLREAACNAMACERTGPPRDIPAECLLPPACPRPSSGVVASTLCVMPGLPCENDAGGARNSELCDGVEQCNDGQDELNCTPDQTEFHCTDRSLPFANVCDGVADCADGLDELCSG